MSISHTCTTNKVSMHCNFVYLSVFSCAETRISSSSKEEGRERRERFEKDRKKEMIEKVGSHKKGRESTVAE